MDSLTCWHCETPAEDSLFCRNCNSLQRPTPDYYRFFELPRKLSLDPGELQQRFYELSRRLHPDRYTRASAPEQKNSLEATAILNDGYRVLRDPVARAEYFLRDHGFDIGEQRSKDVPPELLEEVFELNMALEEVKSGDDSARPQLKEALGRFQRMRDGIDGDLGRLFRSYDETQEQAVLAEIRNVLNRRRYIRNLLSEVEKGLAARI
jgi:molecular chaperone HscB